MSSVSKRIDACLNNPTEVYGPRDSLSSYTNAVGRSPKTNILVGRVEQFNVGMYSAYVSTRTRRGERFFVCQIGSFNVTPGLGYSDSILLREGDRVIFSVLDTNRNAGIILARVPASYSRGLKNPVRIKSDTKQERRTNFFSNDCYRKKSQVYDTPLKNPKDISTARYINNRPTDLAPGEFSTLNPYRNGLLYNMFSTSLVGGGSHIKLFSLENRIRIVADSIIKYTLFGNEVEWHNRRYLSKEKASCLYQEERFGLDKKEKAAFEESDYDEDFYFIKNKKKKQTLRPRILEYEGYFGGVASKYVLRPDPDSEEIRTLDEKPNDPGVFRESIDPSGQYRLSSTGMIGLERVGRIPVPIRIHQPWTKDAEEPNARKLEQFKHSKEKPYYRQLELADRIAFDLKNSYSRVDDAKDEFHVPQDSDLEEKTKDVYDEGFTNSCTVELEKYDNRRSGIWQGEDGSIIIRDAWGSEIVMIGGNIQFSCAGNIETLPGKTALTIAGDDIVQKAQNSIDVESADKDVRINGFKNVQILAGADESNPGGITIEAKGKAYPWSAKGSKGGEDVQSSGILLKSHDGNVVMDTDKTLIRSNSKISLVAGKDKISGGAGTISVVADTINGYGKSINSYTDSSSLTLGESAILAGPNVQVAADDNALVTSGSEMFVPLQMLPVGTNIASETKKQNQQQISNLKNEDMVSFRYSPEILKTMMFKFRSSEECGTDKSWEISDDIINGSSGDFTLYQPFWTQVLKKFDTLREVYSKTFEDHEKLWTEETGSPWPGKDAVANGKYAKLAKDSPVNMDDKGFNISRDLMQDTTQVTEVKLFTGYQIRDDE